MPAPVYFFYGNSNLSDGGGTNETIVGVSWQQGDRVVVFGGMSSDVSANQLATPTITGLSGTGLTFALDASVNNTSTGTDTQVFQWTALAGGVGSGTIQSVNTAGSGLRGGIAAVVCRGSDGFGTPVTLDGSTAKTINLTRLRANSGVLVFLADFAQANDVAVDATPTGTVRLASAQAGQADYFCLSFDDQGAAGGPTAYGITNHTGTVDMSGIALEVFGTASSTAAPDMREIDYLIEADWKPQAWNLPLSSEFSFDDWLRSTGGAININVGLATSANTAFSLGKTKRKTLGLASSSNSSLAVVKRKRKTLGLLTQVSTALALARRKSKLLGLPASANTSLPVVAPHSIAVGLATSANTAFALVRRKTKALGLASSANAAFSLARRKAKVLGLSASANTALVIRRVHSKVLGLVASANLALAIATRRKSKVLGLPTSANTAFSVTPTGPTPPAGGGGIATWIDYWRRRIFFD